MPIDELEDYGSSYLSRVKRWFLTTEFYSVYDFVEWIAQRDSSKKPDTREYQKVMRFCQSVDTVLQEEKAAYRFADFRLVPVTNESEIAAVNQAAHPVSGFANVAAHIRASISLFSDKKPDYRNSIKEAISAVEAAARTVAGAEKATLGDALKEIEKAKKLHPALKDGFLKIYGYSSDADGIRHAMTDMPNVTEIDARFMLVSCSAFSTFLIEQSKK